MGGHKGPHMDYDPTPDELRHSTDLLNRFDTPIIKRKTYEQDKLQSVKDHQDKLCAWYHRGQILVHRQGFAPMALAKEREGR